MKGCRLKGYRRSVIVSNWHIFNCILQMVARKSMYHLPNQQAIPNGLDKIETVHEPAKCVCVVDTFHIFETISFAHFYCYLVQLDVFAGYFCSWAHESKIGPVEQFAIESCAFASDY